MDCNDSPPAALLKGVAEFNRRAYFQCHETLEELWLHEPGPIRLFYQGIIQVAVGLHHLERRNRRGSLSLLRQGIEKLERFRPRCMCVDVADLVRQTARCREMVAALGSEGIAGFPWQRAPRIAIAGQGGPERPGLPPREG